MSQDAHDHSRVDVEVDQEGGAGASGIVDGLASNAGHLTPSIELAVEASRIHRRAVASGEDEVRPLGEAAPSLTGFRSIRVLCLATERQCRNHDARHREGRIGGIGLGLATYEGASDALRNSSGRFKKGASLPSMSDTGDSVRDEGVSTSPADGDTNAERWFVELKLDGERFNALGLPSESVVEVTHYRDALFEVARQIYLDRHPGRERVPNGFDEAFDVRLVRVDRGSAKTRVRLNRATRFESSEYNEWYDIYQAAADAFQRDIASVRDSGSIPETTTPRQRKAFRKVGSTLNPDETLVVGQVGGGSTAQLDFDVRATLSAIDAVVERSPEPLSIVGVIVEFDSRKQTFELLREPDSERIRCHFGSYIPGLARTVRAVMAEDGVTAPDVKVTGLATLGDNSDFDSLVDVSEIEVERPWSEKRLRRRLEELRALKANWLGQGSKPAHEDVLHHFDELIPELSKSDVHIAVAATAGGHVVLEWRRESREYLAEIEPHDRIYLYAEDPDAGTLLDAELAWDALVVMEFVHGGTHHVR